MPALYSGWIRSDPGLSALVTGGGRLSAASLVALAVWIGTGVATALVLRRRGHDFRALVALGLMLGPLFIPLALDAVRHREPRACALVVRRCRSSTSGTSTLVVLDGRPGSAGAARCVLEASGPDLGVVTLVRVVPFEAIEGAEWSQEGDEAALDLERGAWLLAEHDPGAVLVPGRAAPAVLAYARTNGYGLVVVPAGHRGFPAGSAGPGPRVVMAPEPVGA